MTFHQIKVVDTTDSAENTQTNIKLVFISNELKHVLSNAVYAFTRQVLIYLEQNLDAAPIKVLHRFSDKHKTYKI